MNHFTVGERFCLATGEPVSDCDHCCVHRAFGRPAPAMVVTSVDPELGHIVIELEDEEEREP